MQPTMLEASKVKFIIFSTVAISGLAAGLGGGFGPDDQRSCRDFPIRAKEAKVKGCPKAKTTSPQSHRKSKSTKLLILSQTQARFRAPRASPEGRYARRPSLLQARPAARPMTRGGSRIATILGRLLSSSG